MVENIISGDLTDSAGRCVHYHSDRDVIANKCAQCGKWWACYKCHNAHADHDFSPMSTGEVAAMCGACGYQMKYGEYAKAQGCPQCGQLFNPGCSLHAHIYFAV